MGIFSRIGNMARGVGRKLANKVSTARNIGRKIGNVANRASSAYKTIKNIPVIGDIIKKKMSPYESKIQKGLSVGRSIGKVSNMDNRQLKNTAKNMAIKGGTRFLKNALTRKGRFS